jgi:hypothetical protein
MGKKRIGLKQKKVLRVNQRLRLRLTMRQVKIVAAVTLFLLTSLLGILYLNLGVTGKVKAAVTYTWKGNINSSWNNCSNWSPAGVPEMVDNVIILASNMQPYLDRNTSISSLKICKNGSLNLNGFSFSLSSDVTLDSGATIIINHSSFTINGISKLSGKIIR